MGYGVIPKLGEPVTCDGECTHSDCKANREDFIVNAKCLICGVDLIPGDYFYYTEHGKYGKVHRACEMESSR